MLHTLQKTNRYAPKVAWNISTTADTWGWLVHFGEGWDCCFFEVFSLCGTRKINFQIAYLKNSPSSFNRVHYLFSYVAMCITTNIVSRTISGVCVHVVHYHQLNFTERGRIERMAYNFWRLLHDFLLAYHWYDGDTFSKSFAIYGTFLRVSCVFLFGRPCWAFYSLKLLDHPH